MVTGLSACWITGIFLLVYSTETVPGTAAVSPVGFYLLMTLPAVVGAGLSAIRRVRLWAASIVVGLTVGWCLGLVSGGVFLFFAAAM
jgi:hypothetical protein